MAMATFVNGDSTAPVTGPQDFVRKVMKVEPNAAIAPGETKTLKLTITSGLFHQERLIPIGDPQQTIAGLLTVEGASGQRENVTVSSSVRPTNFQHVERWNLRGIQAIRHAVPRTGQSVPAAGA